MNSSESISEQKIQEAIARGEFKKLRGAGKPLKLDDNPHVPDEVRLANQLLINNGFKLPWIEKRNEIMVDIECFNADVHTIKQTSPTPLSSQLLDEIKERALKINQKIMDYNIAVPHERFQIVFLRFEENSITNTENP